MLEVINFRVSAAATILEKVRELETTFNGDVPTPQLTERGKQLNMILPTLNEALRHNPKGLMCVLDIAMTECGQEDACVATPEVLPQEFRQLVGDSTVDMNCRRHRFPVMARVALKLFKRSIKDVKAKLTRKNVR